MDDYLFNGPWCLLSFTQVLPVISALDLEDFIDESKKSTSQFIESHLGNESGQPKFNSDNPSFSAWKKSDWILLSWLLSTISEKVIRQVTRCKTFLDFWIKLESLYARQFMARIMSLRQQLQNARKGLGFISDFVLRIKEIGDELMAAGDEVQERDLLLSLTSGVEHEYDPIVVLVSSEHGTMSLEEAQFLLLMHEQHIEQLNTQID
ncbi:hypothetical protein ACOSQ4_004491 [Xanthoceras sorbifolium]